jgi:hypothetical protein
MSGHIYERFAPLDPSGHADPTNGITESIVGTGGKDHGSFSVGKGDTMATDDPLPIRQHVGARLGWLTRALAAILALTLSTILALTLPHAMPSYGHAAAPRVERLDLHWSSMDSQEIQVNLAVGTGNDCQTTLNPGQYCLRYSVTQDDQPKDIGVGVIPSSAVQINGSTLAIHLNTTKANFRHRHGSGGSINLTWHLGRRGSPTTARRHTTTLTPTTVVGTIDGYRLAGAQLQASYLVSNQ